MDHLSNWTEIPVIDMKRAKKFYGELLGVGLNEMQMAGNDYALFELKDRFNTGCLVKGEGYVPSTQGVVVYLNGGNDLSTVLGRVEQAGGKVEDEKDLKGLTENDAVSTSGRPFKHEAYAMPQVVVGKPLSE